MKILVLGATGHVGSNLLPRLLDKDFRVRCLVRNPAAVELPGVEVAEGDASDQSPVDTAVKGCDRIVYLSQAFRFQTNGFCRSGSQSAVT